MKVIKRDGREEPVSFDKILNRLGKLADTLQVDPVLVAQKVIQGIFDGVHTSALDTLAAETAAYMTTIHPDYDTFAGRICISNLHKNTTDNFAALAQAMVDYTHPKTGLPAPLLDASLNSIIQANAEEIMEELDYSRDYDFKYFSARTMINQGYLFKMNGTVVERPQQMFMRVALAIHRDDIKSAIDTYHLMSLKFFTHASPTLFNAGAPRAQLASCFLFAMHSDSIEGIYKTLGDCAVISKHAGGIGVNMSNIRAAGTHIAGSNGTSNGLVPMIRVFNATARYVDQGGGKRKGAFAIYLEPWHADIFEVLQLKNNNGPDELRARDLFYALWIPDLFMRRVEAQQEWSLFCPHECPGLYTCYGAEFDALYEKYERAGKARKTVPAQSLWFAIVESQIETGTPYMLYKDACNAKSNQKNLGTIQGSNLCTEIIQYTSPTETAVCNLASVALPRFVKWNQEDEPYYDFEALFIVICTMTRNLNRVIDVTYYPLESTRVSNLKHRPMGLGVQGLQDAFFLMRFPFDSPEAAKLNREIFETIYFAALTTSNDLARENGTYESYPGSPASQGILQFDMWNVKPDSGRWDWEELRSRIAKHGLYNSLLVAPMPTASTSQILGNVECFEPISSNIYSRSTLSGTFTLVNEYLVADLVRLGLWSLDMKNKIIAANGSIQGIEQIPAGIRDLYKTVWEIKQRVIVDMAADRGAYIDQSQSLNIHMAAPTIAKMSSLHFHAWKRGLKTGQYYLRTRPAVDAIKFTIEKPKELVCSRDSDCSSCGS
jgi:ribonucleoside-diphosphate reductase alpha chain